MKEKKKTREQVQSEALEIFKQKGTGTIVLATGTGKSKIAIDFILDTPDIHSVLITSPRTNLKKNWKAEIDKWWDEKKRKRREVSIATVNVQTAHKWAVDNDLGFDLIIADEIHTMMAPEYSKVFGIPHTYLMGLTATPDITNKNDKWMYYKKFAPVIYEYHNSADDGLINKTKYTIVEHWLNNDFKVRVKGKGNNFFYNGEYDQYQYLTENIKRGQRRMMAEGSDDWFRDAREWFWNRQGTPQQTAAAAVYLNSIKYRKEFLLKLTSTATIARELKKKILSDKENKVLIFSELTEQIDKITQYTVHSHNSKEINEERLSLFNADKLRELGSCQSLTLGLNLTNATHAIMESYIGSATISKQKKGRLDRLSPDQIAHVYIIVVKDTQSEKWFQQMSKAFDLSEATYINSKETLL